MTKIHATFDNYSDDDFCEMLEGVYGWSVAAQARNIFAGFELEDQNRNALDIIAEFAKRKGEIELYDEINNFLKEGKYKWRKL